MGEVNPQYRLSPKKATEASLLRAVYHNLLRQVIIHEYMHYHTKLEYKGHAIPKVKQNSTPGII